MDWIATSKDPNVSTAALIYKRLADSLAPVMFLCGRSGVE